MFVKLINNTNYPYNSYFFVWQIFVNYLLILHIVLDMFSLNNNLYLITLFINFIIL